MEHQHGGIDLVRWQGRRDRRMKSGVSAWTVLLVACALVGGSLLAAQALGAMTTTGPWAMVPAGLVLAAIGAQVLAVGRAALAWLLG